MYGCESWTIKKAEHWKIDTFEQWCWRRFLRVPWGDKSWVFIGGTDVKAETPVLWPPDAKSWLIGKDPDARKDWGQEEKGTTEDEMVGWHHQPDGHGFGWTPRISDGPEDWCAVVHEVAKNQTQLSDWTELTEIVRDIILVAAQLFSLAK